MTAKPHRAVAALTAIAQTAMDRMNSGEDITPKEAFTLGRITAIAIDVPGVLARIKDPTEEGEPS